MGPAKKGASHELEPNSEGQVEPGEAQPTTKGSVSTARFHSEALGVEKSYYLYLRAGYDQSDARYPVVYMLHGLGGQEDNWTKYMKLTEAANGLHLPMRISKAVH